MDDMSALRQSLQAPEPLSYRIDAAGFAQRFNRIVANVETVIQGKTNIIQLALVAICAEGHVLFEDVPGTGKSMLVRALSRSVNAKWARIQCTPDILPGDITGSSIFDARDQQFHFRPGPIFCNVLLADEINRANPKTQSALLEAMQENSVSVDGNTYRLTRPFLVLATQNPIELAGTFPLPEAQLDRFLFKVTMGYPDQYSEVSLMFANAGQEPIETLGAVTEVSDILAMIDYARTVEVSSAVGEYIVNLVRATREDESISLGGSPRASIALLRTARVLAAADGRGHVYPDDVRHLLEPVLAHRVSLSPEALLRGESVQDAIQRVAARVRAPASGHHVAANGPLPRYGAPSPLAPPR
jgi:MoxR-like ATPase